MLNNCDYETLFLVELKDLRCFDNREIEYVPRHTIKVAGEKTF